MTIALLASVVSVPISVVLVLRWVGRGAAARLLGSNPSAATVVDWRTMIMMYYICNIVIYAVLYPVVWFIVTAADVAGMVHAVRWAWGGG